MSAVGCRSTPHSLLLNLLTVYPPLPTSTHPLFLRFFNICSSKFTLYSPTYTFNNITHHYQHYINCIQPTTQTATQTATPVINITNSNQQSQAAGKTVIVNGGGNNGTGKPAEQPKPKPKKDGDEFKEEAPKW